MATIEANMLVIKAKLALKQKATYLIEGHEGLYLQARADGTGSWVIRYRVNGKQREKTLHSDAGKAKFADISKAKDEWRTAAMVHGRDIQAERDAAAKAEAIAARADVTTLDAVIEEWITKPRAKTLRPKTVYLYRWLFKTYVSPTLGARAIASITKAELAEHFVTLKDRLQKSGGKSKKGTRGEAAGKSFTYLQAVFEHAVDQEYIERSPMRGLTRPVPKEPDQKASRPLRPDELRKVWQGADIHLEKQFARMVKLALLLGRRRAEITGAEMAELDLDNAEPRWTIKPREGNKSALPSLVPLPTMAAKILREAARDAGSSAYVFPQWRGNEDKPTDPDPLSHAWRDLCDAVGVPAEVTLHAARGLLTDFLENAGVPDNIVSHVLHHTSDMKSTTAKRVYSSNSFRAEKHRALDLWQQRLLEIIEVRPASGLRW